jgi:hypothetical protein
LDWRTRTATFSGARSLPCWAIRQSERCKAGCAIIFAMPVPKDDRAALERERDELPALITTYEHELLATPVEEMEKREQLRWQLRLAEKRLAEINVRLTEGR